MLLNVTVYGLAHGYPYQPFYSIICSSWLLASWFLFSNSPIKIYLGNAVGGWVLDISFFLYYDKNSSWWWVHSPAILNVRFDPTAVFCMIGGSYEILIHTAKGKYLDSSCPFVLCFQASCHVDKNPPYAVYDMWAQNGQGGLSSNPPLPHPHSP
jgi:hypothetical protein